MSSPAQAADITHLAIAITATGNAGAGAFASLQATIGPCAADAGEGPYWASCQLSTGGATRIFNATPALCTLVGDGLVLKQGVTANVVKAKGHGPFEGPGARFAMSFQGMPGMRQQTLPDLPAPWVGALREAAFPTAS